MAIIKSITNNANQSVSYHKVLLELSAFTSVGADFFLDVRVASYKDKTTRDSIDPVYDPTLVKAYRIPVSDIRADVADFNGVYSALKELADFSGATDDI